MEMTAIIDADGLQTISGDTEFEVNIFDVEGDTVETFTFWSTSSHFEQDLVDELSENGYEQLEALDTSDAPYCIASVKFK